MTINPKRKAAHKMLKFKTWFEKYNSGAHLSGVGLNSIDHTA